MDPLSALAIAAGVVLFVDSGCRMLKSIAEASRSLSDPEEARRHNMIPIEQTSHDLTELNDQVRSFSKLAPSSSKAEAIFIRHVAECADIAKELQTCTRDSSELRLASFTRIKRSNTDDEHDLARLVKNRASDAVDNTWIMAKKGLRL